MIRLFLTNYCIVYLLNYYLSGGADLPKSNADWLSLIRKQELKHAKDLEAWQLAVKSAADLLKQTENAMSMFRCGVGTFNLQKNMYGPLFKGSSDVSTTIFISLPNSKSL